MNTNINNLGQNIEKNQQQHSKASFKHFSSQIDTPSQKVSNSTLMQSDSYQKFSNRLFLQSYQIHTEVQKLIEQQIINGNVIVSDHPQNYKIKWKKQTSQNLINSEIIMKKKLQQVQMKRRQAIEALKLIDDQQTQIKKQFIAFRYQKQSNSRAKIKKQRSHFSPQQKKDVQKFLKQQQMLENIFNKKTQGFKQKCFKAVESQRNQHLNFIQKEKSIHRSLVSQNIKILSEKKSQRLKSLIASNKKYREVKMKKYFYQTWQEKDQAQAQIQLQQLNKKLELIRKKMKVPINDELKQHEKKCTEVMRLKTQNSMKTNLYFDKNTEKLKQKKYKDNRFSRLIKQQIEMRKKEEKQLFDKIRQLKQKASIYSEINKPKIKITQKSKFILIDSHKSVNSLNNFQIKKKGNQYMLFAKKMKKCSTLQDQKNFNQNKPAKFKGGSSKEFYKNYLREFRQKSTSNPQKTSSFGRYLQKQGKILEFSSLHKAFIVVQSIEAKSKKSENQKLIDSAKNKIQILKMII